MKNRSVLSAMAVTAVLMGGASSIQAACAPKCRGRCSAQASKCAPKCGAKCGAKADPRLIQRPTGYKPNYPLTPQTVKAGEAVFQNTKLSSSGLSCATCHNNGQSYQSSFGKPFPHQVAMASETYGLKSVELDEAIQMCMVGPMAARPFDWKSADLANLFAFISAEQQKFMKR
jgi:cytochrome c peroxidase